MSSVRVLRREWRVDVDEHGKCVVCARDIKLQGVCWCARLQPGELTRGEIKRCNAALKACGIDGEVVSGTFEKIEFSLNLCRGEGVTFEQLVKVSEAFKTKEINLGSETGYYGSHYDHLYVMNVTVPE